MTSVGLAPASASATDAEPAWHALPADAALVRLQSRMEGLTAADIDERRRRFGPNRLPEKPTSGWLGLSVSQFASPLMLLLFAAAAVSLALGEFADAGFIARMLRARFRAMLAQEQQ